MNRPRARAGDDDVRLVRAALAELGAWPSGVPSGAAMRELLATLRGPIQAMVGRRLLLSGKSCHFGDLRETTRELTQVALMELFRNDAAALRRWDPEVARLRGYAQMIADRKAQNELQKRARWTATVSEAQLAQLVGDSPVHAHVARDLLQRSRALVLASLDERGQEMWRLMFDEDRTTAEIMARTGKQQSAVNTMRHRYLSRWRGALRDLLSEGPQ